MFKLKENLLLLSILAILFLLVCSQDQTNEEKEEECQYLNSVRTNFSACCQYPLLVIWRWQFDICKQNCSDMGQEGQRCCILPCCFFTQGVLTANTNEDGSPAPASFHPAGLIYAFMLSVGNDTQWTPVITDAANRCSAQFDGEGGQIDCGVIPTSLYDVINCQYNQNYLKCPTWNPKGIEPCQYTYQFVKKCMAGE